MNEQWCPFAIKRVGAQGLGAKHGYPGGIQGVPADNLMTAPKRGEVKHDSTGPLAPTLGVLDTHPINSWHFTVDEDLYQHYPVDANCWHGNDTDPDDDVRANVDLVGVEHTRVGGALALTTRQIDLTTQLTAWLMETCGWPVAFRFDARIPSFGRGWELCEHNEVGNTPTACPSGRIPWDEILRRLAVPDRVWAYGDEQNGLELRARQQVTWIGGVEVYSIGDPEGEGVGRIAKNFGGSWKWLRLGKAHENGEYDAMWSPVEGD